VSVWDSARSLGRVVAALVVGGGVLGVLAGAVLSTPLGSAAGPAPSVTVKEIGTQLMGAHAAALLIVGVVLTVALLGAIVIAASVRAGPRKDEA
jgi:NADH:ubiquinone oxidoreductase subunit 6 (subunit J)